MTEPHKPRTPDEELLAAELPTVVEEYTDDQRVERMRAELEMSFDRLRGTTRAVSIFGSARIPAGDPVYEHAREVARRLGEAGFTIITGGGPGIMEAGNRGAQEAGARSIGLNIDLPFEQGSNPYVGEPIDYHYFFTRKIAFVRYAGAFVVFPGGFGTMDELFESLTLIQTGKVAHFPVVLVDSAYWSGLLEWIRTQMRGRGLISPGDVDLLHLCDSAEEVVAICERAMGLQWGTEPGVRRTP